MNWILLIIAGLFEVAFAACLGKAKNRALRATGRAARQDGFSDAARPHHRPGAQDGLPRGRCQAVSH